jgi:hypothetical protein
MLVGCRVCSTGICSLFHYCVTMSSIFTKEQIQTGAPRYSRTGAYREKENVFCFSPTSWESTKNNKILKRKIYTGSSFVRSFVRNSCLLPTYCPPCDLYRTYHLCKPTSTCEPVWRRDSILILQLANLLRLACYELIVHHFRQGNTNDLAQRIDSDE